MISLTLLSLLFVSGVWTHGSVAEFMTPQRTKLVRNSIKQPSSCLPCEAVLTLIIAGLEDKATMKGIVAALDAGCHLLPKRYLNACLAVDKSVGQFLRKLPSTLHQEEFTPFSLCSMGSQCLIDCCQSKGPEQVQLGLTGAVDEISVTFVTPASEINATPTVKYVKASGGASKVVVGKTSTYTHAGWRGTINHVVLDNLAPDTMYNYTVGTTGGLTSKSFQFKSQPLTYTRPLRFAVVGDMGASDASDGSVTRLIAGAQSGRYDALLHDGDTSYSDGYQHLWDVYGRKIQDFSSRIPITLVPGNHEIPFDFGTYKARHFNPNTHISGTEMYWSMDMGLAHVIGLSTESEVDTAFMSAAQLAWLKADLAAVDRSKTPWLVVMGHRPWYCTSHSKSNCVVFASQLRAYCEDLFYQYKVDLVIQAHRHDYESTYPVYKGKLTKDAPRYIVNGAAGCRETLTGNWDVPQPPFSKFHASVYGYSELTIHNSTSMVWNFIEDSTGTILDHIEFKK